MNVQIAPYICESLVLGHSQATLHAICSHTVKARLCLRQTSTSVAVFMRILKHK